MSDMTWKEFEDYVRFCIERAADGKKFRIEMPYKKVYKNQEGEPVIVKIMDCHLAEKRQGGCGLVFDAKHFCTAPLSKREIDDIEDYRKKCKASAACIIASEDTEIPDSVRYYAESRRVDIICENRNLRSNIQKYIEYIFSSAED